MIRKFIYVCLASLVFTACEKEIKLKDSDIKSRIVVNGLFETEDTLKIQLSESRDILFNNGGVLPDILTGQAKLLTADNQSIGEFVHEGSGLYYLPNFLPKPGVEYKLKVNNTGFDEVSAINKIPASISISNIDTLRKADYMDIDITFSDNGNEENYYGILIIDKGKFEYEIEPGVVVTEYYDNSWVCTKDLNVYGSVDPEGDICSEGDLLISDDNFNGSNYTITVKKYMDDNPDTLIVSLRSISADLYKYKTTLQKYNEVQGNPFGEPVQVFSNIVNGFGIFAGQSVYTDTIFIK
ncbi:MAG: DUF4249 domain-containing protein [Crocinitomicaceae bacterium]